MSIKEYHDHILPRSLCKYLYNIYHPCDPVAYRVEPIFMKFYSKVEPVHLTGPEHGHFQTSHIDDMPLQPLQNARKDDESSTGGASESASGVTGAAGLPLNIANGSINLNVGKMLPNVPSAMGAAGASMSPSISLPKMPSGLPGLPGTGGAGSSSLGGHGTAGTSGIAGTAAGLTVKIIHRLRWTY